MWSGNYDSTTENRKDSSMVKAIVSGASGFIGKALARYLKKNDIEVVAMPRNLLYKSDDSLQAFLFEHKPDYIFALHAYGNMANQIDENKIVMANYFATWNLLQASKFIDYKAFIFVSSSSVLLDHETFYSASKAGAERLCQAYQLQYHKHIGIARPYSIYGVGEADHRFIPTVFRSCLKGEPMMLSEGTHDWVYVDDFVAFLADLAHAVEMCEIFAPQEFGLGKGIENRKVVKLIEKITGKKANIIERKKLRSFDNDSWYAEEERSDLIQLEEGLKKIYKSIK